MNITDELRAELEKEKTIEMRSDLVSMVKLTLQLKGDTGYQRLRCTYYIRRILKMADVKSLTATQIVQEAKAEVVKEKAELAKRELKLLLKRQDEARAILANIEREIKEKELEITQAFEV